MYTTVCIPSSCTARRVTDGVPSCILKEKKRHDALKANTLSFEVCFNFIMVLLLTIGNDRLRIVLLAKHIHPPFDNGSSTIRSLVHMRVVLGCQVKIVRDNPPVINHALCLLIYKNAGLTTSILRVPVNITARFFAKGTRVPFLALSLLHAWCIKKI